jgi:hypothetical protein
MNPVTPKKRIKRFIVLKLVDKISEINNQAKHLENFGEKVIFVVLRPSRKSSIRLVHCDTQ